MSTAAERNARADARAREAGYRNRSQQYRARKANYRSDQGAEYNVAMQTRRSDAPPVTVANTRAGTVISADLRDPGAARALIQAIRKAAR